MNKQCSAQKLGSLTLRLNAGCPTEMSAILFGHLITGATRPLFTKGDLIDNVNKASFLYCLILSKTIFSSRFD